IGFREAASLGIDDLEHGLVVDTEFLTGKKPGLCPSPAEADKALLPLEVSSGPIHDMIRDLVARHVAITSTLPVFETLVPNRAPLDGRVLDAMLPEARISYLRRRDLLSDGAAKSDWPALRSEERRVGKEGGIRCA